MIKLIKKINLRAWNHFNEVFPFFFNKFLLFLSILYLVSCLAALASSIALNSSPAGLLAPISIDLENAVQIASRTTFYNVNFFYPYGPLLYRLIDFMNEFSPNVHFIEGLTSDKSKNQMSNHFYLIFMAGLIPYFVGFIIGVIIKANLGSKFLLSAMIGTALLHTVGWQNEMFLAHPDVLVAALTSVLPLLIFKAMRTNSLHSSTFNLGVALGIGMCIKFSFITFLPSILLTKFKNKHYKVFLRSILYIIIVSLFFYFLLGFPHNFISIIPIIEFLFFQSSISIPPNIESVSRWFHLLFNNLKTILPFTILLTYFFSPVSNNLKNQIKLDKKFFLFFCFLILLPIILLFYQNYIIVANEHYVLPYVTFIMSSCALLTFHFKNYFKFYHFKKRKIEWNSFIFLLLIYFFSPGIPENINSESWHKFNAKTEYLKTAKIIKTYENENTYFFKSAYVTNINLDNKVRMISEKNITRFLKGKDKNKRIFLMLSYKWYSRFNSDNNNHVQWDVKGLGKKEYYYQKKLYDNLFNHNFIENLGKFKKVYSVSYGENTGEQYWVSID